MKKWLSRGIVLAMVMALMIPAPVLAKSSKSGGKLVKSVTTYEYNATKGRWKKVHKTAFTYDKKNNPKEIRETDYHNYVLGVPTQSYVSLDTYKYKYKGKTPKSMKVVNSGEKRKYKKGRLFSVNKPELSTVEYDDGRVILVDDTEYFKVGYNKKGLATSYSSVDKSTDDDTGEVTYRTSNFTYAVAHKKGIPSLITQTFAGGSYTDPSGNVTPVEGSTTPFSYVKFNGKGLVVESGSINSDTGAYEPDMWVEYTKKKGKITKAYVYYADENGAKKATPTYRYDFKYGKKKISKLRYLSMMNSLLEVGEGGYGAFFSWY